MHRPRLDVVFCQMIEVECLQRTRAPEENRKHLRRTGAPLEDRGISLAEFSGNTPATDRCSVPPVDRGRAPAEDRR